MADILCEHGRVVDCEDVDCLLAYADASKSFRIAWKIIEKLTAEIKEAWKCVRAAKEALQSTEAK